MTDALDSAALGRVGERCAGRHGRSRRNVGLRLAVLTASAILVVACGGGDDDSASSANPPAGNPPASNVAPTISGTPLTQVMQNAAYSFTPTASDANSDTLTFSILGKPSWASFDTTNGKLSGTPTSGDVGTYSNIRISVSDSLLQTNLTAFSVSVVATSSGAATLTWTAPTQNTDGSALTNLAGYKVYWGTAQNSLSNQRSVGIGMSTAVIDQLTPATWYFAVTALDTAGNESAYSNVATKTVN